MRAAVITEPGGPDVLKVMEVDDPVPGPEDVLVDVKARALNRADMLQREGGYPAPPAVLKQAAEECDVVIGATAD